MRTYAVSEGKPLKVTTEQRSKLKDWLQTQHQKALDSRFGIESVWRTSLRMYQGTPPDNQRWLPFENAPVIEITIGAMAADSVYAQACDLIFQTKPPLTIRSRKQDFDSAAEALQDLVNWGVESGAWNFSPAAKDGLLDDVQLGTMVWYVPYTKTIRKTDIREVVTFGPKIHALAPEDFIIPANSTKDIQAAKFCTMRLWMGKTELNLRARLNNWTVDDAASADSNSIVRKDRMRTAGLTGGGYGDSSSTICVGDTFAYYDIDGDGIDEDLEIIWNMTSGNVLKVMYNRNDCRPFVLECYQDRAHLAYGVGVLEMMTPYEREVTEIHNNHVWNMMIANNKMYTGPSTAMQEMTSSWPGKFIPNDDGAISALEMGETNPSAVQAVGLVTAMARERVGVQNLSAPIRASSRTPGISMLSMMQQANRRFTPAFDNMRNGLSAAVMQALFRIQEQVRGKNRDLIKALHKIMGGAKAEELINLFNESDIELTDAIDVQLTAASVSVNREADRQNMVMLATQIYQPYLNGMAQLAEAAAKPPFPGADKIAKEAAAALNRLMRKIIKTFDQISDVQGFLIELDQIQPAFEQIGMENPLQGMAGALQSRPNGAAPQPAPPNPGMLQ